MLVEALKYQACVTAFFTPRTADRTVNSQTCQKI